MADSNQNSEDENGPDDYPNYVCFCDTDSNRVKNLSSAINDTILSLLDSNPNFSSFVEVQLLSFQRELSLFVRRLFEAKRQNSIKVLLKRLNSLCNNTPTPTHSLRHTNITLATFVTDCHYVNTSCCLSVCFLITCTTPAHPHVT